MSNCSDSYNNVCRQDIPYPQVSPESVPSLIDNLVTALYGAFYNPQTGQGYITKSVVNGRVVWTTACDPNNSTQISGVPRQNGEGLLCYIMRIFALYDPTQYIKLTGPQTITNSTFANGTVDSCTFINPIGLTKANVGLGNVDNTADTDKPLSNPQNTAVNNAISAALAAFVPTTVANLTGGVAGSIPYQSAPSTTALLPPGTAGFVLRSNGPGLAPSWAINSTVSESADDINGGAAGEILYQITGSNTGFLPAGTNNYVLKSNGAGNAPTWVEKAPKATTADTATTAANISGGAYGDILWQSGSNTTSKLGAGSAGSVLQTGVAPSTPPSWVPTSTAALTNTLVKRDGSGNITANSFVGNLTGNANTANGLQPVLGLSAGTYGSASTYPVITITAGGQITAAINQQAPIRPTVVKFLEDKDSYSNVHRFYGGAAFIASDNTIRFFGQASNVNGTSPAFTWNSAGLGTSSRGTSAPGGMIISPEYLVDGEYPVKIYGHHRAFFVLTNLGNLYAAGQNGIGQLGLGFTGSTTAFPRKCSITNVVDFAISQGPDTDNQFYCIAVRSNGSVWTWGLNSTGQLGNGTTTNITTPTEITAINDPSNGLYNKQFDKCYAGGLPGYCYVIERTTKNVYSCGYNGWGHLGLSNGNANVSWFTALPSVAGSPTTADEIYTSGGTNNVVASTNHTRATSFLLLNGQLYSCGSDVSGETGLGTTGINRDKFTLIPGLSDITDVTVSNGFFGSTTGGGMSVACMDSTGRFWVWGSNSQGQLGNNPVTTPAAASSPLLYTELEQFLISSYSDPTPWPSNRYISKIKFLGAPAATNYGVRGYILDTTGQMWIAGDGDNAAFGDGYQRTDQVCWRKVRQNGINFVDFDVTPGATNPTATIFAKDEFGNAWSWGWNGNYNTGTAVGQSWVQTPEKVNFF